MSSQCRNLLHRLLQPDPNKRATMAEVMQHPWFQCDLPPPLLTLNSRCASLQIFHLDASHLPV